VASVETTESGVKGTARWSDAYGSGKTLEDVRIRCSKNGGYVVDASYRRTDKKAKGGMSIYPDSYMPPETLTFSSFDSLVAGLKKVFGK
jgi:hypothetical protein